jgi:transposase-like protein
MKMTIEQFRELAAQRRAAVKQGGARYTKTERAWAVGWAEQSGLSRTRAARELNIADPTLCHWRAEAKSNLVGVLERVHVVPEQTGPRAAVAPSRPALMLRTAQGHELGPLDLDTAVALLRALA